MYWLYNDVFLRILYVHIYTIFRVEGVNYQFLGKEDSDRKFVLNDTLKWSYFNFLRGLKKRNEEKNNFNEKM